MQEKRESELESKREIKKEGDETHNVFEGCFQVFTFLRPTPKFYLPASSEPRGNQTSALRQVRGEECVGG